LPAPGDDSCNHRLIVGATIGVSTGYEPVPHAFLDSPRRMSGSAKILFALADKENPCPTHATGPSKY
jgi:hypothetical protein